MLDIGIACGCCGGNLFMATCDNFRGTGHEWALVSICMICRAVYWTEGCHDCAAIEPLRAERCECGVVSRGLVAGVCADCRETRASEPLGWSRNGSSY